MRETGGRQGGRPELRRRAENVWEDKDMAGIKRLELTRGGIAWMTCMDRAGSKGGAAGATAGGP